MVEAYTVIYLGALILALSAWYKAAAYIVLWVCVFSVILFCLCKIVPALESADLSQAITQTLQATQGR